MKDLIVEILEDHKKIKKIFENELDSTDLNIDDQKEAFNTLSMIVTAHSKSEEAVLYAPSCGEDEIKDKAFEGMEKHALVDLLMEEMRSEENEDRWSAKYNVMCDLLLHHLEEEEMEFLPKLEEMYSKEQRAKMGVEYRDMYERLMRAQKKILDSVDPKQAQNH